MYMIYNVPADQAAVATTFKTAGNIIATTGVRPQIFDFTVGCEGTPADNSLVWQMARSTQATAGTSTAVTPQPEDSNDPAATATAASNYTAEPTVVASTPIWGPMAINQRATYRWVAAPGSEILLPAAANGVVAQVKSPGFTGQADIAILYRE